MCVHMYEGGGGGVCVYVHIHTPYTEFTRKDA